MTDIIGTMDQFNGVGKYSDEYKGGKEVYVDTMQKGIPDRATISENVHNNLEELLHDVSDDIKQRIESSIHKYGENNKYILSFENYLKEGFQKRPPQDPDYDERPEGWNDTEEEE